MVTTESLGKRATVAMKEIMDLQGYSSGETGKAMLEEFAKSHNTAQQAFFRGFLRPLFEYMAATEWIDARNEGSREFARKAKDATADVRLPFI